MPAVEPLELFYVTDGTPLTAENWWLSHRYYRHRQNLHYQSLHQSGIVHGLGVRAIDAPDTIASELRDGRWLEVQPGIAIDLVGNPIVVEQPVAFRITSEVIERAITVYVALAYVDPRQQYWSRTPATVVKEDFRLNERTTVPSPQEVELCRITITDNNAVLSNAADVFHPGPHEIDLRGRQQVQERAQHLLKIALVTPIEHSAERSDAVMGTALHNRLSALLQAADGLYSMLVGCIAPMPIMLTESGPARASCDTTLLVLSYAQAITLTPIEIEQLQAAIAQGSTVLIEYTDAHQAHAQLENLYAVKAELNNALSDLQTVQAGTELSQIRQSLMDEKTACDEAIRTQHERIEQPIDTWGQPRQSPNHAGGLQRPFVFDALPVLPTGPIHLTHWDGIVLVVGSLSAAWMPQQFAQPLSRDTLRSAQELGINLLYQASWRQQMIQAQQQNQIQSQSQNQSGQQDPQLPQYPTDSASGEQQS